MRSSKKTRDDFFENLFSLPARNTTASDTAVKISFSFIIIGLGI